MAQGETENTEVPAQPEGEGGEGKAAEAAAPPSYDSPPGVWGDDSDADPLDADVLTDSEGAPDEGEAEATAEGESVSEGEGQPATPTATQPQIPPGFNSLDEVVAAAQRARAYEQTLLSQQAAQAPAQKGPPPLWSVPHGDNPAVTEAVGLLRRAQGGDASAVEAFKSLPQDTQARAGEQAHFLQRKWAAYTADPTKLLDEVLLPAMEQTPFASKLRKLETELAQLRGERFLQKHAAVISTPADQKRLAELAAVMPEHEAVRVLGMEKKLKSLDATSSQVSQQQRQIEASKAASRAAQSNKGRGGTPRGKAGRIGSTDPREIAKVIQRRMNQGS